MTEGNFFEDLKGKKILVVDDVRENQMIESIFLKRAGAFVDLASNGLEAIEKALNGSHDAVLMDLHMPYLDGLTATARLRDQGYSKPIIAVTADTQNSVRRRAIEVGFDDYLSKPLKAKDLLSVVAKFCGNWLS